MAKTYRVEVLNTNGKSLYGTYDNITAESELDAVNKVREIIINASNRQVIDYNYVVTEEKALCWYLLI